MTDHTTGATGELLCLVCGRWVTTLVRCNCKWRSCPDCYGEHPHHGAAGGKPAMTDDPRQAAEQALAEITAERDAHGALFATDDGSFCRPCDEDMPCQESQKLARWATALEALLAAHQAAEADCAQSLKVAEEATAERIAEALRADAAEARAQQLTKALEAILAYEAPDTHACAWKLEPRNIAARALYLADDNAR